jgi:methionyl-tRNA synthetase
MAVQALSRALEAIFEVIGAANRYVDAQAPWALRKTDPERMATVLFVLAETIRRIALLTQAFMPDASGRILDQLAVPEAARSLRHYLDDASALRPGTPLPAPSGVFPRLTSPGEPARAEALGAPAPSSAPM